MALKSRIAIDRLIKVDGLEVIISVSKVCHIIGKNAEFLRNKESRRGSQPQLFLPESVRVNPVMDHFDLGGLTHKILNQ